MSENPNMQTPKHNLGERLLSAISVGAVFILIGIIYISTPGLWEKTVAFFSNFTLAEFANTGIFLPAPIHPSANAVLYGAAFQFCLGFGILEILFLTLRVMWHSPIRKTAETMGNLVFWLGASYLIVTYLNETATISKWFVFWAGIIVFTGLSLIARAFVLLAKRR